MSKDLIAEIKEEYYSKWVSPRGLTLLEVGHSEPSNSILFHCEFIDQLKRLNALEQSDLDFTFNVLYSLQKRDPQGQIVKGVFNRTPKGDTLEAHDNRIAIIRLSQLFKFSFAREMFDRMVQMGMSHNNIDPDTQLLKTTTQGGDVACHNLGIGYRPEILNLLWLSFGLVYAGFRGNPSVTLLSNVRKNILQTALDEWINPVDFLAFVLKPVVFFFELGIEKRGGLREIQKRYFVDDHPICRLTKIPVQ